jgi:hypothetical protein
MAIYIYKNGSSYSFMENMAMATNTMEMSAQITDLVSVMPGDYIDIRVLQNSDGSIALRSGAGYCTVAIEYTGS